MAHDLVEIIGRSDRIIWPPRRQLGWPISHGHSALDMWVSLATAGSTIHRPMGALPFPLRLHPHNRSRAPGRVASHGLSRSPSSVTRDIFSAVGHIWRISLR